MTSTSSSTRKARKDAREREVLEAALQVFVERGFAATTAEEVADRAGVSKGTLFLYYKNKYEILRAVVSTYSTTAISSYADAVRQHRGPVTALLSESLVLWWQQVYDGPESGVIKLVNAEARNFPELARLYLTEVIEPAEKLVAAIVEAGIASGEFRPVNVRTAARSLLLPMATLCMHKHSFDDAAAETPRVEFQSFVRGHVALILGGLSSLPVHVNK